MTVKELKDLLRGEIPSGVYLFAGEESYLRRAYLSQIRKKILTGADTDTFNHYVGEGADPDLEELASQVDAPPFFAPKKLVEWHGANLGDMGDKRVEALLALAERSRESDAVVVLSCAPECFDPGTAKRPSALYRKLSRQIQVVNFEKAGDAQLLSWLKQHFDHEGLQAEPDVLKALLTRVGHSMDVLANETEKLSCALKAGRRRRVTREDVERYCTANIEEDAFGLTNALMEGDGRGAYRNLCDLRDRRIEPTVILGQISRLYTDILSVALLLEEGQTAAEVSTSLSMNPYRAELYIRTARMRDVSVWRRCLALVGEADRQAKLSYGAEQYALLDRLVAELLQRK